MEAVTSSKETMAKGRHKEPDLVRSYLSTRRKLGEDVERRDLRSYGKTIRRVGRNYKRLKRDRSDLALVAIEE